MVTIETSSPTARIRDSSGSRSGGSSSSSTTTTPTRGSDDGYYVELNPDGTVKSDVYIKDASGNFVKDESIRTETETNAQGDTIIRTYRTSSQLTPELKQSIEAGNPYPVYSSVNPQDEAMLNRTPHNVIVQAETPDQAEARIMRDRVQAVQAQRPQGEFRQATPEEAAALRRARSPTGQFMGGLWSALNPGYATGEALRSDEPLRSVGATAGLVGQIALFRGGGAVVEEFNLGEKAVATVGKVGTTYVNLKKTSGVAQVGLTAVEGAAVTAGATKVYSEASQGSVTDNALKQADISVQKLYGAGFQAQEEADLAGKQGASRVLAGVAYELPGVPLLGDKKAFERGVINALQDEDLTAYQKQQIAADLARQRTGRNIIEFGGQVFFISRAGEGLGRSAVAASFGRAAETGQTFTAKESFNILLKKGVGANFAKAGFAEGSASVASQEITRGKSLLESSNIAAPVNAISGKDYNLPVNNILLGGAFGAASATVIGGAGVLATSIKYPKFSKVVEVGGYLTDYGEYVGDKTRDAEEYFGRRFFGANYPEPQLFATKTGEAEKVFSFSPEPSRPGLRSGRTPTSSSLPSIFGMNANAQAGSITIAQNQKAIDRSPGVVQSMAFNEAVSSPARSRINTRNFVNIFSDVPTQPAVPINSQINLGVNTQIDTSVIANVQTQTETNINTGINTRIGTDVPVVTPIARLPVPLPLELPLGMSGGAGSGGKRGKRYLNEVVASQELLSDLIRSDYKKSQKALKPKSGKLTKKEKKQALEEFSVKKAGRTTAGLFNKVML